MTDPTPADGAAAARGPFDRIAGLFGREIALAPPEPVAPVADYVLTPDRDGAITLAGYKIPLALALIGLGVGAALLINRRTRAPLLAAATTAWGLWGASKP